MHGDIVLTADIFKLLFSANSTDHFDDRNSEFELLTQF